MLSSWLGRSGIKGNGTGYPARVGLERRQRLLGRLDHQLRPQLRTTPGSLTAIDIVAHENGHGIFHTTPGGSAGDNETGGMNEATGDIFGALTEAYAANPNDPADFTGRRGGRPGRRRPDPLHVQPERRGRPELLVEPDQEHRGARGRRPAQPLVLPAVAGLERLAGQPDLQRLDGHRRRHPDRRQDLLQRPAAEDLELDPRRRPQGDAAGRGQPVRHHQLHQLQHGQGGLGRGLGAGPVR